jgi:hypothetical protein
MTCTVHRPRCDLLALRLSVIPTNSILLDQAAIANSELAGAALCRPPPPSRQGAVRVNPSDEPLRRLDGNVRGIVAVLSGVALSPLGVPPSLIEEAVYLGSSLLARQVNAFPLCG